MEFRKSSPQDKSRPTFHDAAYIIYVSLGLIAWYVSFFQWESYPLDPDSASGAVQVVGMMMLLWFGLPLLILLPAALGAVSHAGLPLISAGSFQARRDR